MGLDDTVAVRRVDDDALGARVRPAGIGFCGVDRAAEGVGCRCCDSGSSAAKVRGRPAPGAENACSAIEGRIDAAYAPDVLSAGERERIAAGDARWCTYGVDRDRAVGITMLHGVNPAICPAIVVCLTVGVIIYAIRTTTFNACRSRNSGAAWANTTRSITGFDATAPGA